MFSMSIRSWTLVAKINGKEKTLTGRTLIGSHDPTQESVRHHALNKANELHPGATVDVINFSAAQSEQL